jgi:hypothetical protein
VPDTSNYLHPLKTTLHIWVAQSVSRSWQFPSQLRNSPSFMEPKIHYRVHNSPTPFLILSLINTVHPLAPYFLKIRFNMILPSTPRSIKWSILSNQNTVQISQLPIRATSRVHPILDLNLTVLWSSSSARESFSNSERMPAAEIALFTHSAICYVAVAIDGSRRMHPTFIEGSSRSVPHCRRPKQSLSSLSVNSDEPQRLTAAVKKPQLYYDGLSM